MSFVPRLILVPFDYSERCVDALRRAQAMVDDNGKIHVVHVIEDYHPGYPATRYPQVIDAKHRVLRRRKMEQLLKNSDIDTTKLSLACEIGDPGSEISRMARELSVDLVVVPSHGRRGLTRLLLGSVAERVARLAPCPVLILK